MMTKYEWEKELKNNLKRLPAGEVEQVLDYYNELFADKAEEGMSEKEIVKRFGNPFDVAYKILYDNGADTAAPAELASRIKPAEPFTPYEAKRPGKTADGKPANYGDRSFESAQPAASVPGKKGGALIAKLVFFVPYAIFMTVLWSLVIGFAAGGLGAAFGGAVMVIRGVILLGESGGMFMAITGTGLAAIGIGLLISVGAVFMVKGAAKLTMKYFYMGKHKTKSGGNKYENEKA